LIIKTIIMTMSTTKKITNNEEAFRDAAAMQTLTLKALERTWAQLAESIEVGLATNGKLTEQQEQTCRIQNDANRLAAGLQKSNQLLNKLGRWGLRFGTERRARSEAKRKMTSTSKTKRETINIVDSKSEKQNPKSRRQNNSNTPSAPSAISPKRLLEGADIENNEHKKELEDLASTDDEINRHLNEIDLQVDNLLTVARSIRDQVATQSEDVERLTDHIEQSNDKQLVVNRRTRQFLDGKLRKQYTVQDTILSPGRMVAIK
jgi:hypothetical protein